MIDQDKRCGTCKWWGGSDGQFGADVCKMPLPDSVMFNDNNEWMAPYEGTTCPCWEAKE